MGSAVKRVVAFSGCSEHGYLEAVEALRRGGLVIYPTDTAYALGGDAENPEAVERVYRVKLRPKEKPLTIAVSDFEMARRYAVIDERAEAILREFLPGPITFILRKTKRVPDVVNPRGIGIRIPDNQIALELISRFGRAVTATSANLSGNPPPYSAEAAMREIPEADVVIDAGRLPARGVSTIVDLRGRAPALIRPGPVPFERVLAVHRRVVGT